MNTRKTQIAPPNQLTDHDKLLLVENITKLTVEQKIKMVPLIEKYLTNQEKAKSQITFDINVLPSDCQHELKSYVNNHVMINYRLRLKYIADRKRAKKKAVAVKTHT